MAPLRSLHRPAGLVEPSTSGNARAFARDARRAEPRFRFRSFKPNQSGDVELWELHEELLKEIEQRKQQQEEILRKFKQISVAETKGPAPPPKQTFRQPTYSQPPPIQAPQYNPNPQAFLQSPYAEPPPLTQYGSAAKKTIQDYYDIPALQKSQARSQYQDPAPPEAPDEPPIPENVNAMKVIFVGAEVAPWSKTGGLGDVMGALPKAMTRRGHRVMVIAPRYDNYDDAWETGIRKTYSVMGWPVEVGYFHAYKDGVDYVFVDHPCYHNRGQDIYGGERQEIQFRCALLCKAALEAVWHVPCGGIPYGDDNCVFVANDWHTALLPVYLQAHYRDYDQMQFARSVFVIHNIAHQGRAPFAEAAQFELNEQYSEQMRLYDPVGGEHMNIMKAGLQNAHRVIAVSTGYAWECQTQEGGWGLDGVLKENAWKLQGIVNGIDYKEWSPQYDAFLRSDGYTNYTLATLQQGKAQCKEALQRELGLPVDRNIPMLGFIGRLDYQKGVDIIRDIYDWLVRENVQLVMLGSGREDLENELRQMESRNVDKCKCWVGFSVKMAHRITAGIDILLMPSRFEPCGLNQLYAMAYGTVPVVHAVGGLRDTVQQVNPFDNTGTGWTFDRAEGHKLQEAVGNALLTFRQHRQTFADVQRRGMEQDLSWDNAANQYEEILVAAKYQW